MLMFSTKAVRNAARRFVVSFVGAFCLKRERSWEEVCALVDFTEFPKKMTEISESLSYLKSESAKSLASMKVLSHLVQPPENPE